MASLECSRLANESRLLDVYVGATSFALLANRFFRENADRSTQLLTNRFEPAMFLGKRPSKAGV